MTHRNHITMNEDQEKLYIKLVRGSYLVDLAELWFTFLEYSAITAVFHSVSELLPSFLLATIIKWICYGTLFFWISTKFEQFFILILSSADIAGGGFILWHHVVIFLISSSLGIAVYYFSVNVVKIFMVAGSS